MTLKLDAKTKAWFNDQVASFSQESKHWKQYADLLREVLSQAARGVLPQAIVQARPKSIPSFAEKVLRKWPKYTDPVRQLTDLCGARVIVHTNADVESVSRFIREHFEIDEANSQDSRERLQASEFGYRSVHFIVELRKGAFPTEDIGVRIPAALYGRKAEIQVRTVVQHAWADIGHDRLYKSAFRVPKQWLRQTARIAALLEDADESFLRIVQGVDAYRTRYDAYMSAERMEGELEVLGAVLPYNADDQDLVYRIGRLLLALERPDEAIDLLRPHAKKSRSPRLIMLHGAALCEQHRERPNGRDYRKGQEELQRAVALSDELDEAALRLAESYVGLNDELALDWFEKAYKADASEPRALSGYLKLRIAEERRLSVVSSMRPAIEGAIRRCQEHVEIGVNLPAAWYYLGEFYLLLERPYESLHAYAKAAELTHGVRYIEAALETLSKFRVLAKELPQVEWARRLLLLAKAARGDDDDLAPIEELAGEKLAGPVAIVAGGCDESVQERMEAYRDLLFKAFEDFRGAILSGGTTSGIAGLVGDLMETPGAAERLRTIGYVPKLLPADAELDRRYTEIRQTDGADFTALEPLQNWIDLLASGVRPAEVKVFGINGGAIAALEYRLAHALGAKVGVLRDSGREAGKLAQQAEWEEPANRIALLPTDPLTAKEFVEQGAVAPLPEEDRERIGQAIHDAYLRNQQQELRKTKPAMVPWEQLDEGLKESNYQQGDHIARKLQAIGKRAVPVEGDVRLYELTPEEVEILAELEHARWNVERLLDGWTLGPRDQEKKQSPYLLSWADLPDDVKRWDRDAMKEIPALLKQRGLEIQPQ